MQDKEFDSTIKNSLQNLEVPYDASSWDLLEKKMQSRQSAAGYAVTDDVDNVVKKALIGMEVAYNPANWDKMSKKIDNTNVLRQRIMITKFAEAAIFLLLVWNFGSMLFTEKASIFSPKSTNSEQSLSEATPTKSKNRNATTQAQPEQSLGATIAEILNGDITESQLNTLQSNALNIPNNQTSNVILATLTSEVIKSEEDMRNQSTHTSVENTAFLPSLPLENVDYQKNKQVFNTVVLAKHREKKYYVSNYAAATHNRIKTPYDKDSQKPAYEQWTDGYGAGFAIGKKGKKWSVETGLAYNSVTYNPQKNIKITNSLTGIYLKEIDLEVASMPVSVNRKMARVGKSTFYAKAGVTAHAVTQASYRYQTIQLPPTTPNPGGPDNPNFLPTQGKGIFEGGSISNNAWVTADAGIRIERPINRQMSIFIEPMYSSVIAGKTGPKNDKIAGLALNAGVTSRL
jgi:hypothetical protein